MGMPGIDLLTEHHPLTHNFWRSEEKTLDFDRKFNTLTLKLLANQLDFDYGDEDIISRHAKIVDVDGQAALQIGMAEYFAVAVPNMITIRRSTLNILHEFCKAGGKVLTMTPYPTHIDGRKDEADFSMFEKVCTLDEMAEKLEDFRTVSFSSETPYGTNNLLYQLRNAVDRDTLFICNTGHRIDEGNEDGEEYLEMSVMERKATVPEVKIKVKSAHSGAVVEFDPAAGKYYICQAEYSDGMWTFDSSFGRLQSRLYIFCDDVSKFDCSERENSDFVPADTLQISPEKWDVELSEKNAVIFDRFTSRLNSEPEYVLAVDDKLRMDLGIPVRDFVMVQPWCCQTDDTKGSEIEISAAFNCEYLPQGELCLVIETPELYSVQINGNDVELNDCGAWHEAAWRKCLLPSDCLQKGENVLTIRTFLTEKHSGLEAVFLLGDFGVKYENDQITITEPVAELYSGSWTGQGLPFYAGNVTYSTEVELPAACRGKIKIAEFYGTPAEIRINDGKKEILFFAPDETSVLDLPQKFKLSVTITGSLRNACGPFFCGEKSPAWCGPAQFKSNASSERMLAEYGLCSPVEIIIGK